MRKGVAITILTVTILLGRSGDTGDLLQANPFSSWVSPKSHSELATELILVEPLDYAEFEKIVPGGTAIRLRVRGSSAGSQHPQLTISRREIFQGHASIFYPLDESAYSLEIWSGGKMLFQGGFQDPFRTVYEREIESGKWEHEEIQDSETLFEIKTPLVPDGSELRIYRIIR